jgi:cytochrome c oxidase subunit 2
MPPGVRRKALLLAVVLASALASAGAAYAGNGGIAPPGAASENAQRVRDAYWVILAFTGFIFVLVEGALVVFLIKYRRGRRPRTAEGPQIHGSGRLEIAWTVFPVVILTVIAAVIFYKLPGIRDVPKASAAEELTVKIQGRQFYWLYTYPNGAKAIDTLVAPADRVVRLEITAPDWDVIHSWWIPKLGGKWDAIPGKVNKTWFRASPGVYVGRCAELCGLQHAIMTMKVDVRPAREFDRWVAARKAKEDGIELGREEFQGVCLKCHNLNGPRLIGPTLAGNSTVTDRGGLETLLRNGQGQMPPVGRGWTDAQIDALIAYTKTLPALQNAGASSGG